MRNEILLTAGTPDLGEDSAPNNRISTPNPGRPKVSHITDEGKKKTS